MKRSSQNLPLNMPGYIDGLPDHVAWVSVEQIDASVSHLLSVECMKDAPFRLTPAELGVAEWFVKGRSYHEIATKRGIRRETVKSHIRSILGKARCANRVQMVLLVLCLNHSW